MSDNQLPVSAQNKEVRQWAMLCHFAAFLGLVFPFGSVLGPLILWQVKKGMDPLIDDQGKEALSSAGVAGVGGGATFAALIVLPAMGLPVSLVALLISVEPLIDMGRTALNVSGSITAGAITSQIMQQTDKERLNADEHAELAQA